MCIADMAAGRRTWAKQSTGVADVGSPVTIRADARRVGLLVVPTSGSVNVMLSTKPTIDGAFAYLAGRAVVPPTVLRIEQYGQIITGDVYVIDVEGGTPGVTVTELISDAKLDTLIQEEAG